MEIFDKNNTLIDINIAEKTNDEIGNEAAILCNHCNRTATNGIRCMGICVSDSDY
tara:strand:- start:245 stop:409 length:165 start_codon:yes stop_codon:yes gene_type:complete